MGFADTTSTRIAGLLSLIGLVLVTLSDFLLTEFWGSPPTTATATPTGSRRGSVR